MSHELSPVCVYCGSATGSDESFRRAAQTLGQTMAKRNIDLVFGGGRLGLMGAVADAVLEGGGKVTGIITKQLLDKEVGHNGVHDLRVVDTMHQRKKIMADIARGFVALPGGVGTLDELFEILAWAQLGIHNHPVGMLNVRGYFDHLLAFLRRASDDRFLRIDMEHALLVDDDAGRLLDRMSQAQPLTRRTYGNE